VRHFFDPMSLITMLKPDDPRKFFAQVNLMGSIRARVIKSFQEEGTEVPVRSHVGAESLLQILIPLESGLPYWLQSCY
jgi:hypothetical protein